jgi:pimeloyl-ACP methyl ester carboxylesterase
MWARRRLLPLAGALTLLVTAATVLASAGTASASPAPSLAGIPAAPTLALPLPGQPSRPDQDAFYRTPADTDDADPGDLLRYRSSRVSLAPGGLTPAPVRAWQVLYRSTTAQGDADAVSGTVLVPDTRWTGRGHRPVVSYTIGTHGLGDQCAPSYELASGSEQEFSLMSEALARGWAVAVTDYEGLGTPGDHAYAVQLSEGRAALDVLRAATALPPAGLSDDAPMALWGYSQGGGAAASAAEQARQYAPELHLVGVAEGGVPADLQAVARNLDGGVGFGLLAGAAAGYDTGYPDIGVRDLLNARGRALLREVRQECVGELTARHAGGHLADYARVADPLGDPRLVRALRANRIGGVAPDMPVLLYHAQFDELIPIELSRRLRAEYCSRDVRVDYRVVPVTEHVTGAIAGAPPAVDWLAARFAGRPAPTTCT